MVQKRLIGIGVVILIGILLVATLVVSSLIAYVNTLVQDSAPQLEVWLNLADQGLMYLLIPRRLAGGDFDGVSSCCQSLLGRILFAVLFYQRSLWRSGLVGGAVGLGLHDGDGNFLRCRI